MSLGGRGWGSEGGCRSRRASRWPSSGRLLLVAPSSSTRARRSSSRAVRRQGRGRARRTTSAVVVSRGSSSTWSRRARRTSSAGRPVLESVVGTVIDTPPSASCSAGRRLEANRVFFDRNGRTSSSTSRTRPRSSASASSRPRPASPSRSQEPRRHPGGPAGARVRAEHARHRRQVRLLGVVLPLLALLALAGSIVVSVDRGSACCGGGRGRGGRSRARGHDAGPARGDRRRHLRQRRAHRRGGPRRRRGRHRRLLRPAVRLVPADGLRRDRRRGRGGGARSEGLENPTGRLRERLTRAPATTAGQAPAPSSRSSPAS